MTETSRPEWILQVEIRCKDVTTFMDLKQHLLASLSALNPSVVHFEVTYWEKGEDP